MKQLMVAMRCGDQTVVSRCWLFIGQSLLHQGQFGQAARVVRFVWRCCHQPPLALLSYTTKLLNMCRGVWARLRHERGRGKSSYSMPERKKTCVEVEQKSSVPVRYRTVLETAGARLVSEKTLSDVYFDTEDLTLLRGDVWLRRRGTQWELKVPTGECGRSGGGMTRYREVMGKMVEMVRVVAVRESWIMGELSVVIDRMEDDDWSVGEVELVVNREVEVARKKVQKAVTLLGFTPQEHGKVEHCLGRQNTEAAAVLMEVRRMAGAGDDGDKLERKL